MSRSRWLGLTVLILLGSQARSASSQEMPGFVSPQPDSARASFRDHLSVEYGLSLFGLSAYRSAIVPTARDYVLSFRGLIDPLGRYRTDFAATLNPSQRLALTAFATASTLERNRFYGYGNASIASQPTAFYRLDQMFFETGLSAGVSLGAPRNQISAGPFYRFFKTDRELPEGPPDADDEKEAVDGGGVMRLLRPYGVGAFKQIGIRSDLRLSTEGPRAGHTLGVRFYGGGAFSPPALSVRAPVLSLYSDAKAFVRIPGPADPILYVRGTAQRVFGAAPFQDAAYLGGSSSLRGLARQRYAGDLALTFSGELYGTLGQLRVVRRPITFGAMALADVGRVFNDGLSIGPRHLGAGGGVWLRDERTGREVTLSVAKSAGGPRLYFAFGEPFWR